jgi:hypothetical protein
MPTPLLTVDMFADKVGQTFALDGLKALPIELTLTEAKRLPRHNLPDGLREPFSLLFTATGSFILPQQIYALGHATLGLLSIFLVPIGRNGDTVTYQAVFN